MNSFVKDTLRNTVVINIFSLFFYCEEVNVCVVCLDEEAMFPPEKNPDDHDYM